MLVTRSRRLSVHSAAQRLIVDAPVGHQVVPHDAQVMTHQLADYLAHGDHDPAEQYQTLA
jgi:hypothetical protein